ncbi:3722_t:CDS:2, partial [Funneliformis mosseae]
MLMVVRSFCLPNRGFLFISFGPAINIAEFVSQLNSQICLISSDLHAKKKRWEVNGAIQPNQIHDVYFVDPTEESRPLLEKIHQGQFVALHGPRVSGKFTRVLHMNHLQNKTLFAS